MGVAWKGQRSTFSSGVTVGMALSAAKGIFSVNARSVRQLRKTKTFIRPHLVLKCLSTSSVCEATEHYRGFPLTTDFSVASTPHISQILPTYRVLDEEGSVLEPSEDPKLSDEIMSRMFDNMITLTEMDRQLFKAQRMGLISFYMMCAGEEASHFGSAAALDPGDPVYAQYRETGVLMWRGFTVDQFMNQCFSTSLDQGKGKQMPIHYGSKPHNFQFISSPLATQLPQAPGYAYGLKRSGSKNCVIVYFGDGAAQEGDAHAAMNFAAVLGCPVIFFCRNNGYAISTPVTENYAGDGIISRASGYGMEGIRVDGNDVLAVYNSVKHARKIAVEEQRPVLVEAITLRMRSHSSSDDQTLYQDMDEVSTWEEKNSPLARLRGYLQTRNLWNEKMEADLKLKATSEIKQAMQEARSKKKPRVDELFKDVYDKSTVRLDKQRDEVWELMGKYKDHYSHTLKHHEK